jgi:hypothetical protein
MRVLNIDLDFFLNDKVRNVPDDPNCRPDGLDLVPWGRDEVVAYLETALNLRTKTPGSVVQSHHEVFFHWRNLIEQGKLTSPFFITHVDAHADLGMAMPAWVYLHTDFLDLSLAARPYPLEGDKGLNFGSYMAFAIGNRWFSALDFVTPHFWHDDIPRELLTDDSPRPTSQSGEFYMPDSRLKIELRQVTREDIDAICCSGDNHFRSVRRSIGEPAIPFNVIAQQSAYGRYDGQIWDYVFLSHSPGYVPTSADTPIPVIADYIGPLVSVP